MAARTARTYLNEGLAVLAEMNIPQPSLRPFQTVFKCYSTRVASLEVTIMLERSRWEVLRGVEVMVSCLVLIPRFGKSVQERIGRVE